MTTGLAGFAAESYSTFHNILQRHSTGWDGADGTALTITQRTATVGATALQRVKGLVDRLREVLDATDLVRTVPASYTEPSAADDGLASYVEYQVVLTVERTLEQAGAILNRAQEDLGLEVSNPLLPVFPVVPEEVMPPRPVPMPGRQRRPQGPTTMEI
ncbi:MAG: hypothetical protein HOQ36_10220 [Nocardia sp.]|nr:hypothetical protein [Nocardia sp.]